MKLTYCRSDNINQVLYQKDIKGLIFFSEKSSPVFEENKTPESKCATLSKKNLL